VHRCIFAAHCAVGIVDWQISQCDFPNFWKQFYDTSYSFMELSSVAFNGTIVRCRGGYRVQSSGATSRRRRRRDRYAEGVEVVGRECPHPHWGWGSPSLKIFWFFFQLKWRGLVHPVKHFCSDIEIAEYQLHCGFRCKFTFSYRSLFLEINRGGNYSE